MWRNNDYIEMMGGVDSNPWFSEAPLCVATTVRGKNHQKKLAVMTIYYWISSGDRNKCMRPKSEITPHVTHTKNDSRWPDPRQFPTRLWLQVLGATGSLQQAHIEIFVFTMAERDAVRPRRELQSPNPGMVVIYRSEFPMCGCPYPVSPIQGCDWALLASDSWKNMKRKLKGRRNFFFLLTECPANENALMRFYHGH